MATMVNTAQAFEVPIAGPGLVYRPRGTYGPGEYKTLNNCEILSDGTLRNRRPLMSNAIAAYDPNTSGWKNVDGIVGNYRSGVVTAGGKEHHKYCANFQPGVDLWSPSTMNTVGNQLTSANDKINNTATDWRRIVGFFRYNKANYWIVQSYIYPPSNPGTSRVFYHLLYVPDFITAITLTPFVSTTFAQLTAVQIVSIDVETTTFAGLHTPNQDPFPDFKGFFIHKDRLVIVTTQKIYFSKVADPTVWTTPDGGFFGFGEDISINAAVAFRDSIYVIADNSTYSITYTGDPSNIANVSIRKLTDGLGGDSCVLWGDTVYFARDDGLYSMTDQNVQRVMDLSFYNTSNSWATTDYYFWKLVAFGSYIIAIRQTYMLKTNGANIPVFPDFTIGPFSNLYNYFKGTTLEGDYADKSDPTTRCVFFINMENGAVHSFDSLAYGAVSDVFMCPVEDDANVQRLFILFTKSGLGAGTKYTGSFMYTMSLTSPESVGPDDASEVVIVSTALRATRGIRVDVELSGLVPDGDEFFIKRFRNLMFEGEFSKNYNLAVKFDNQAAYTDLLVLGQSDDSAANLPYPVRVGINQRGRAFTFRLYKPLADITAAAPANIWLSGFVLRKLALLWSPTSRGPANRKYTP